MQSTKEDLKRPVETTGRPFQTAVTLPLLNGRYSLFAGFTLSRHSSPCPVMYEMLF